jgi:hypothetical protein
VARSLKSRCFVARIVVLGVVSLAAPPASGATVVLVRPAAPSAAMAETLVRIGGELASVGFATEVVDAPADGQESPRLLETMATKHGADAVIALIGDAALDSVEVWVVDKVTGKAVVRTVPFEKNAEHAPERLAIRALELLRSSFLEIDLASQNPEGRLPPPAVVQFVDLRRKERPERLSVEVGGTALMSVDGVGPAFLPLASVGWAFGSTFVLRASVAGLGTRPAVENSIGSAQVSQGYGLVGGAFRFRAAERVRPFVALSAGAMHVAVDGRSNGAFRARSAEQWSFLLDGAVGASVRLRDRFYLSVALEAQLAEPYVAIRFADQVVATAGRPNALLTTTVGAWL